MKKLLDIGDELYKSISKRINQLEKFEYTYDEMINSLKIKVCPYAYHTTGFLMKRFGRRTEVGGYKIIIMPTEPIYFNLIKIFFETGFTESIYESVNAPKYPNAESADIGIEESEENKIRKPKQWSPKHNRLELLLSFSDVELVDELRSRSYIIKAEKNITL